MKSILSTEWFDGWFSARRDRNAKLQLGPHRALGKSHYGDCKLMGERVLEMRPHCGPVRRERPERRAPIAQRGQMRPGTFIPGIFGLALWLAQGTSGLADGVENTVTAAPEAVSPPIDKPGKPESIKHIRVDRVLRIESASLLAGRPAARLYFGGDDRHFVTLALARENLITGFNSAAKPSIRQPDATMGVLWDWLFVLSDQRPTTYNIHVDRIDPKAKLAVISLSGRFVGGKGFQDYLMLDPSTVTIRGPEFERLMPVQKPNSVVPAHKPDSKSDRLLTRPNNTVRPESVEGRVSTSSTRTAPLNFRTGLIDSGRPAQTVSRPNVKVPPSGRSTAQAALPRPLPPVTGHPAHPPVKTAASAARNLAKEKDSAHSSSNRIPHRPGDAAITSARMPKPGPVRSVK